LLSDDQVDSDEAPSVIPSLLPMQTFDGSDWHLDRTLGPEAGVNISSTGWARQRGKIFTRRHDPPVALPNSMRALDARSRAARAVRGASPARSSGWARSPR
jgi:hypothetical protein